MIVFSLLIFAAPIVDANIIENGIEKSIDLEEEFEDEFEKEIDEKLKDKIFLDPSTLNPLSSKFSNAQPIYQAHTHTSRTNASLLKPPIL